ncbi:MAG: efflux RND transporter permease subunit, partial [bacterium]
MPLSDISIRRPTAVAMFFLAVVLIGAISFSRLSVDLLPDLSFPKLTVWTTYKDVAPEEIETIITQPIEQVVSTVSNVKRVSSISREGVSVVTIEFVWGTDMNYATLNVREKLDQLRWVLPREAGRPTIVRIDPSSQPIMSLSVSGTSDLVQLKEAARAVIKRRLEQIKGVALAQVTGGLEREIQIELDETLLETYHLTIEQIARSLAETNYNLPGGSIKKGRYRYSLRTLGEFQQVDEIGEIVVGRTEGGGLIYLKDIAEVRDHFKEREQITRYNGHESIGLIIHKESGSNTVAVSERVRGVMAQLAAEYPDIKIAVAFDQADFITGSISNVIQAIVFGGILAFLVLFLFLHDV